MDRLTSARVFLETAQRGSLTSTASFLNMSRASVSRYIADLEEWAGVQLLHRTTRRVSLTGRGEKMVDYCQNLIEVAEQIQSLSSDDTEELGIPFRMASTPLLDRTVLTSIVTEYMAMYPQSSIEILLEREASDLIEHRLDFAVQTAGQLQDTFIARRVGSLPLCICAAPSYLAEFGEPSRVAELSAHRFLLMSIGAAAANVSPLILRKERATFSAAPNVTLKSDDLCMLREAAIAGAGLLIHPCALVSAELGDGRLREVMADFSLDSIDLYAVYPSRRLRGGTIHAMIELLIRKLGEPPYAR